MPEVVMTLDPWIIEEAIKRGFEIDESQPDVYHMVGFKFLGFKGTIFYKRYTTFTIIDNLEQEVFTKDEKWWVKIEGMHKEGYIQLHNALDGTVKRILDKLKLEQTGEVFEQSQLQQN